MTPWARTLGVLVAVRVAIPLAALSASGHKLPALPRYEYGSLTGDAPAYLSTGRALVAGWRALGAAPLALIALALVAGAALAARRWRARPGERPWLVAGYALLLALAAAAAISRIDPSPAGAVGWPLLWMVPLVPLRAFGTGQDPAFAAGLALSLLTNAATVVATAYAGLYATGRRTAGLAAGAFFALWPILVVAIAGTRSWGNGTWAVDAGLHLFGEPLSTACVAVGGALVLSPLTRMRLVLAGLAFGYAFAVRPTNGLVALAALALVVWRARQGAVPFLVGALAVAPIVLAFAPKRTGYELRPVSDSSGALFGARYAGSSWTDSLLWSPRTLIVLVPLAVLGAITLRRRDAALFLSAWVLSNAVLYSFVRASADHPRYLFASLPALLVLWCAGVSTLLDWSGFRKDRTIPARA